MKFLKSASKPGNVPDQPNTRRRSFMWKIGAAIPAVLAAAIPGKSSPGIDREAGLRNRIDRLSGQLGILEDENAIRKLHRNYEHLIHSCRYEEVVNLFTDDGEVAFNGGIFKGKSSGIRRLYGERFKPCFTGRKIEPAPGFQRDIEQQQDIVKVAADRKTAAARFSYSIQVGTPIISDSQLVRMARLHGEGIMKWWEGGTYEVSYVKDTGNGSWKIKKLEYRVLLKSDHRPGKSHAKPVSIPPFSKVFPEDPAGPDILIDHA
ncbi:MAG: nuclear transport factor 2 family protein [Acidobacteria bacterium]|nr:nuclear transport factor 2 family protein [Acidobacteriota bacterium]